MKGTNKQHHLVRSLGTN